MKSNTKERTHCSPIHPFALLSVDPDEVFPNHLLGENQKRDHILKMIHTTKQNKNKNVS